MGAGPVPFVFRPCPLDRDGVVFGHRQERRPASIFVCQYTTCDPWLTCHNDELSIQQMERLQGMRHAYQFGFAGSVDNYSPVHQKISSQFGGNMPNFCFRTDCDCVNVGPPSCLAIVANKAALRPSAGLNCRGACGQRACGARRGRPRTPLFD